MAVKGSWLSKQRATAAQLVALLACEEQLLPSWRSLSSPDPERLAEERRLFYLAATRAKDRLLITHAAKRGRRPLDAQRHGTVALSDGKPWSPASMRLALNISA